MSNIGPNFRPPWQQAQTGASRQANAPENPGATAGPAASNAAANLGNAMAQAGLTSLLATGLNQELALASNQLLQLLRNLLQMPKEMAQLLALLADADPAAAQAMLQQLLQSEAPIPLAQLQQLMLSHADAAQDKLMKLLQTTALSPGGPSSQMAELSKTMADLLGKAKESPTQALQSTINLYLPYPLHPPQAFSLRYEKPDGDGEGAAESQQAEQLALYIDTLTLGSFKITLAAEGNTPLQAIVHHEPVAASFEPEIAQQVAEAMGGPGRIELLFIPNVKDAAVSPMTTDGTVAQSAESFPAQESIGAEKPAGQQSVALHPSGGVSLAALYGAYAMIRVIFEIDERNKLHQSRAAML